MINEIISNARLNKYIYYLYIHIHLVFEYQYFYLYLSLINIFNILVKVNKIMV